MKENKKIVKLNTEVGNMKSSELLVCYHCKGSGKVSYSGGKKQECYMCNGTRVVN